VAGCNRALQGHGASDEKTRRDVHEGNLVKKTCSDPPPDRFLMRSHSGERNMPIGRLSFRRPDPNNDRHHLYDNNGTFYAHFTVHFQHRKRRVRVSLNTPRIDEAKARRDELLARVTQEGFEVPDRRPRRVRNPSAGDTPHEG